MLGTKLATSSCLPVCSLETLSQPWPSREPWPPSPPSLVALEFGGSSHVGLCSGAFWQTGTREVERSELLGEKTGLLQSRQEVKGRENGEESVVWGHTSPCGPGQPASLPEHASLAGMVEGFMS